MAKNAFIITLTGPSLSGKSMIIKKIENLRDILETEGLYFCPERVPKYTTRPLRIEEIDAKEKNNTSSMPVKCPIDVISVEEIPPKCDLVYQTYGVRYGLETMLLQDQLNEGRSPIVVINDVRVVEELKKVFPGRVLSLYLFRNVPDIEEYKSSAESRGNVSENELLSRYEKAVAIHRMYIENIVLFDKVILNAIEYSSEELKSTKTIVDIQLRNIISGVILGKLKLQVMRNYADNPLTKVFVIAGNAASGKDQLIRAVSSMGKIQASIIPKYTSRDEEFGDGNEIICKRIPDECILREYNDVYYTERAMAESAIDCLKGEFERTYRQQVETLKRSVFEKIKKGEQNFWEEVLRVNKANGNIDEYYQKNAEYIDIEDEILKKGCKIFDTEADEITKQKDGKEIKTKVVCDVIKYETEDYLVYVANNTFYCCKLDQLGENRHRVIVASYGCVFRQIKKYYNKNVDDSNVVVVFAHSDISEEEFHKNSKEVNLENKKKEFVARLMDYVDNIVDYNHVLIFAEAKFTYERTSKEEELIDQLFRLFRAY